MTRRTLLVGVAGVAGAASARAAGTAIRLGGPIFLRSDDPAALAREHRRLGHSAAYCPNASMQDAYRVRAIERAFAVENCRRVIDAVKPKRTKFTIEMMPWNLPDGPDAYVDLIKAVARPAFGVHLDVCNAINSPRRFYESGDVIRECFRKLGRWIASCHAKDLQWVPEYN